MEGTGEQVLRRLTIADPAFFRTILAMEPQDCRPALDARSVALLGLGAAICAGSGERMWHQRVEEALDAGLTFDEIVGCLVVLAPRIGIERTVAVAPELAAALGYPLDDALESLDARSTASAGSSHREDDASPSRVGP